MLCLLVPASAAFGAPLRIVYRSASDSAAANTQGYVASSQCPPGTSVAGGGSEPTGGFGELRLNSSYPSKSSWGTYYDSYGATRSFTSHVICVNRPITVRERNGESQGEVSEETPRCPAGQRPSGGGVFSSGGFGTQGIKFLFPEEGPRSNQVGNAIRWLARLTNLTGTPDPIAFNAYAMCAAMPLRYRDVEGRKIGEAPGRRVTLTARCHEGERLIGGGGGAASLPFFVEGSFPVDTARDADERPDDAWRVQLDNFSQYRESVIARAICVEA